MAQLDFGITEAHLTTKTTIVGPDMILSAVEASAWLAFPSPPIPTYRTFIKCS